MTEDRPAQFVSPVGSTAAEAQRRRAARSAAYRTEQQRFAPYAEIAAQVILHRTRHGLTQAQLAERVGTSHSAISRIERGEHSTNVETLRRLADALGVRLRISFQPVQEEQASAEELVSV